MPERETKTSTVPAVGANVEFFRRDPNDFLSRLVTMEESWLYPYDPETKQQSVEWRHSSSPRPKFPSAKTRWKNSRLDFLRSRRHKEKRRGKFTKGVLFLNDNAPAHQALATQKKLAYQGFQCLDHSPYSPDMAPSDYHLFPGLKKIIESPPFFVRRGAHAEAETWLDGQHS